MSDISVKLGVVLNFVYLGFTAPNRQLLVMLFWPSVELFNSYIARNVKFYSVMT